MKHNSHEELLGLGKDIVSALAVFAFLAGLGAVLYGLRAVQNLPV